MDFILPSESPPKLKKNRLKRGKCTPKGEVRKPQIRNNGGIFQMLPDELIVKIFRMAIPTTLPRFHKKGIQRKIWFKDETIRTGKCEDCSFRIEDSRAFHKLRKLKNHVKIMHGNVIVYEWTCPVTITCEYSCHNAESLKAHISATHLQIKDRSYIIDVLGNVCGRFRRIAGDKAFWREWIALDFSAGSKEDVKRSEERFKSILDNFLGGSAKDLSVNGNCSRGVLRDSTHKARLFNGINKVAMSANKAKSELMMNISKEGIDALSSKCPNLVMLRLCAVHLTAWPTELHYWQSLVELSLCFTNSPNTFKGIQLHRTAPNLQTFRIKEDGCPPIMLPDMTQCHRLSYVEIIGGGHQSFCFSQSFREIVPFSRELSRLRINMIEFVEADAMVFCNWPLDTMEVLTAIKKHSTGCKVEYEFCQDMTTICSGTL